MPPSASSPSIASPSAKAEAGRPRLVEEIAWGRPIFRPPQLPAVPAALDCRPFRTQAWRLHWPAAGR